MAKIPPFFRGRQGFSPSGTASVIDKKHCHGLAVSPILWYCRKCKRKYPVPVPELPEKVLSAMAEIRDTGVRELTAD
jgi:hypothetical protein